MKTLNEMRPADLRRAADIKDEIVALQGQMNSLLSNGMPVPATGRKLHWTKTPQGQARLSKILKKHWRKVHKQAKA